MTESSSCYASSAADLPSLLATKDWDALRTILAQIPDQDIATCVPELEQADQQRLLLRLLPIERASHVFSHLSTEQQAEVLETLADPDKARLLMELPYDDAAALLHELPDEHSQVLMEMFPREDQQILAHLLAFPEHSAGRFMTPEFVTLRPDWSIGRALDHVREHSALGETVNVVFVTDEQGVLLGVLSLRELLLGRPWHRVETLAQLDVISIEADVDREKVAGLMRHYDLEVLPVVDAQGILLGIITVDDVMDVVEQEGTEDFHKMASVGVMTLGLKEASMSLLYRKRIGWLIILVVVNLLSGATIAFFETAIEAVIALVFFLPLVIASGGNAGAQSATLMVRAIATGDVQTRNGMRLWGKELLVSIGLGITLALTVWGAGVWLGGVLVGMAVAIAMFLVVIIASLFGLMLPFALNALRIDPATASAPLITSVVDVLGIFIYFSVATAILQL
ncbi:magnesium transporter [Thiorhodospira sibirica]|uniref:magnesium transporter n=1 Tax=Thiorhodospira sibirica TaxID=154347 RepID=UPI00022C0B70|nr:magnesium transporter [Thiorhodospira sibirica]